MNKSWHDPYITPHERSVRYIKSMSNDELEFFFVGNLPMTDAEKEEERLASDEDIWIMWWNNLEIHDKEASEYDFDYRLFHKCMLELFKTTPKQRIERFLNIASDGGWQAKHRNWKKNVHERDIYKCQVCGANTNLHAHHIKPREKYPELQFDISNGITLCHKCHAKEHPNKSNKLFFRDMNIGGGNEK